MYLSRYRCFRHRCDYRSYIIDADFAKRFWFLVVSAL